MLKIILLLAILGLAWSTPTSDNKLLESEPNLINLLPAPKTPASTEKLSNIVGPVPLPLLPRYVYASPFLPTILPYAYAYSALSPVGIHAVPSSYSVEQHGYTITY